MNRYLMKKLITWEKTITRKPLLLWGARQVGKTYILQEFGKTHFPKTHYFNFEKSPSLHKVFATDLEPKRIINELEFYQDHPINIKTDLIIFDEIQECPRALTSLKYFCEEIAELALCAAGSLLGLQLSSQSFPVGKVEIVRIYPLCFEEFLEGLGDDKSLSALNQLTYANPTVKPPRTLPFKSRHHHTQQSLNSQGVLSPRDE